MKDAKGTRSGKLNEGESCPRENRHAPARLSLLAGIKERLATRPMTNP
jgi:hypothetical protein